MLTSPESYKTWISSRLLVDSCETCGWVPYPGALIPCENITRGPFLCPNCGAELEVKGGGKVDTDLLGNIELGNRIRVESIDMAKEFKDKVLAFLKSTNKTSWGKIELQTLIKDLWIEFLEEKI